MWKTVAALLLVAEGDLSATEKSCRFVDTDDPAFSIVLEPGAVPLVTYDGETQRYESTGTGTGMAVMLAYPPNGDESGVRAFAVHEYGGHTFLTWGSDLLVGQCE